MIYLTAGTRALYFNVNQFESKIPSFLYIIKETEVKYPAGMVSICIHTIKKIITFAAATPALCAAKVVPLREFLKPSTPYGKHT